MSDETPPATPLTRDQFTKAGRRRVDTITVPGVGPLRVRSISQTENATFEGRMWTSDNQFVRKLFDQRKPWLLILCMLNPADDSQMWTDEDYDAVKALGPDVVDPTFEALEEFCRIKPPKPEDKAALEKKSDAPSASST
ncbi:hypothetical protein [Planctomyces sp. SH-PL14]|uniref:hypothetical protein n=1 Tax=Planctomyces sp. SH-PL14 TaxID=1632864 RepID=UPI00078EA7BE|nr:hypothetical protein [Planctomyces sp. SH-PL14]AMV16600.1 hypothetical protein VT03_01840 [Planctomyces sp. SH-PL14]